MTSVSPKPRFGRAFLMILVGLMIASLAYVCWRPSEKAMRQAAVLQAYLVGTESASLTFFRVDPLSGHTPKDKRQGPHLVDWKILQETPVQDPQLRHRIRSILTSVETYGDQAFSCFDPGLGFRFEDGGRRVELVICLSCRQVYVYDAGRHGFGILSETGVKNLMEIYTALAQPDPPKK